MTLILGLESSCDETAAALVDSDRPTVRLTHGLVFGTPCQTVAKVGTLLNRRGWTGAVQQCPDCHGSS
jgi:hypothetical protein